MKKLLLLLALGSLIISCDDSGKSHGRYHTEYLISGGQLTRDSLDIEYIDENERWQKRRVRHDFYYEFDRKPFQKLEVKVTDLSGKERRILARIYKNRKTADYIDTTGRDLFLHLKD